MVVQGTGSAGVGTRSKKVAAKALGALAALGTAVLVGLSTMASPAWAADFTVNSTNDPGAGACDASECTLREAINVANASRGRR